MLSHASGTFDPLLVQISVIVAIAGAFVALELAAHAVSAPRKAAHRWLSAAAVAFGASVWTMHFLGMLAYRAPSA